MSIDNLDRRIAVEVMGWKYIKPSGGWTPFYNLGLGEVRVEWNPSTDLNHAKLAWDKLSEEQQRGIISFMVFGYTGEEGGWSAGDGAVLCIVNAVLDPLKLCNAILLAVGRGSDDLTDREE